jgi:sugar lactone lactonase YvrE
VAQPATRCAQLHAVSTRTATPFIDGLFFGEGPRWHDSRLWFSDFYDQAVFSVGTGGDKRREVDVPGQPSGLGWLPDGRLLVVRMTSREVLRREPDGTLVVHGSLHPWAGFHANDMVVSEDGRAYVGNFGFDLTALFEGKAEQCNTSLVRIDPDGTSHEAAPDMAFPNGSVIFPGGKLLVVAESFGERLTAFDVAADGTLSGRRVWASLPGRAADGICLDAEGRIWVANPAVNECLLVAEGGEIVDQVTTSLPCVACMLGGPDRRTLYCMTVPTTDDRIARTRRDAKIEQVEVDVEGAGLP